MTDKRTFTDIMANPRRVECEARFVKLVDELQAAGYKPNDIAHGALHGGLDAAARGGAATHAGFLRHLGTASAAAMTVGRHFVDRLAEIRAKAH